MNKRALIKKIVAKLTEELQVYFRAAQFSRAEATHESSKAESKYDTRGLEASYLARGPVQTSRRARSRHHRIRKAARQNVRRERPPLIWARSWNWRPDGESTFYFLGPRAGGTEILHDKKEILVITPQSPLGEQLMGKKSGDQPQLLLGGRKQAAKILKVA